MTFFNTDGGKSSRLGRKICCDSDLHIGAGGWGGLFGKPALSCRWRQSKAVRQGHAVLSTDDFDHRKMMDLKKVVHNKPHEPY